MKNEITCKLTGTRGKGVKAHIIPRSFYHFGDRVHEPASLVCLEESKSSMVNSQIGEYDTGIVTEEGEAYFRECDDYAAIFLIQRGLEAKLYHDSSNPLCIEIPDFNYQKLKLFFISLLWRAGVSSRPMFRKLSLGAHEERLKEHILEKEPGDPNDYSVILGMHRDTPEHGHPMIEPIAMRDNKIGFRYYKFLLGKFSACIKVDSRPHGSEWENFVIRPDMPLRYVVLGDFYSSKLYKTLKNEVRRVCNES